MDALEKTDAEKSEVKRIMLHNWTSREKKLLGTLCLCLLIVFSLLFSSWMGTGKEEEGSFVLNGQERLSEPSASSEVIFDGQNGGENGGESGEDLQANASETEGQIFLMVDVKGAVAAPNVYTFKEGMRIKDAIEKAGGLAENGSTKTLNLAQHLTDGMVVYVPTEEEIEQGMPPVLTSGMETGTSTGTSSGKINLNTAGKAELETLPGIGPSRAEAIIRYREDNGGFANIDDVLNVPGIGPKIFETIRDEIEI